MFPLGKCSSSLFVGIKPVTDKRLYPAALNNWPDKILFSKLLEYLRRACDVAGDIFKNGEHRLLKKII